MEKMLLVIGMFQVPGRSLLPCHDWRHILPYIVGEDEHDDELPDEEPAFLPVE